MEEEQQVFGKEISNVDRYNTLVRGTSRMSSRVPQISSPLMSLEWELMEPQPEGSAVTAVVEIRRI